MLPVGHKRAEREVKMERREFLQTTVASIVAMTGLRLSKPEKRSKKPKRPEFKGQEAATAAMVTNKRLRQMVQKFDKKDAGHLDVRIFWNKRLASLLRSHPRYFVNLRRFYGLDVKPGWVGREINADMRFHN